MSLKKILFGSILTVVFFFGWVDTYFAILSKLISITVPIPGLLIMLIVTIIVLSIREFEPIAAFYLIWAWTFNVFYCVSKFTNIISTTYPIIYGIVGLVIFIIFFFFTPPNDNKIKLF
jgi:hypothetical protein